MIRLTDNPEIIERLRDSLKCDLIVIIKADLKRQLAAENEKAQNWTNDFGIITRFVETVALNYELYRKKGNLMQTAYEELIIWPILNAVWLYAKTIFPFSWYYYHPVGVSEMKSVQFWDAFDRLFISIKKVGFYISLDRNDSLVFTYQSLLG